MKTNVIIALAALLLTAPGWAQEKVGERAGAGLPGAAAPAQGAAEGQASRSARVSDAPKIDPAELKSVPSISLAEEPAEIAKNVGKIVRLRFSYRSKKPAGMEGDKSAVEVIHDVTKHSVWRIEAITLTIPSEGAAWLARIPTAVKTNNSEFVYARIVSNSKAEALGTKLVNGSRGPELGW